LGSEVWAGLDYGETMTVVCVVDDGGKSILQSKAPSDSGAIHQLLKELGKRPLRSVVLEGSAPIAFTRQLRRLGLPLVIVDPKKASKLLSFYRNKTDLNDARGLADIGRLGAAPRMPSYLRSEESYSLRNQLLIRESMIRQATTLRHMMRSLLRGMGSQLKSIPKGPKLVSTVDAELSMLQPRHAHDLRRLFNPMISVHEEISRFVRALDHELSRHAKTHAVIRSFTTIPGVGPLAAVAFYAAVDDPQRFRRNQDVGSYLGLVPRVKQSGDITRRSPITRQGDKFTRQSLMMSAWVLLSRAKTDCDLKDWARRIEERSGHYCARIALARKLSVVMISMWKNGTEFEPRRCNGSDLNLMNSCDVEPT
jgi:transposase